MSNSWRENKKIQSAIGVDEESREIRQEVSLFLNVYAVHIAYAVS